MNVRISFDSLSSPTSPPIRLVQFASRCWTVMTKGDQQPYPARSRTQPSSQSSRWQPAAQRTSRSRCYLPIYIFYAYYFKPIKKVRIGVQKCSILKKVFIAPRRLRGNHHPTNPPNSENIIACIYIFWTKKNKKTPNPVVQLRGPEYILSFVLSFVLGRGEGELGARHTPLSR